MHLVYVEAKDFATKPQTARAIYIYITTEESMMQVGVPQGSNFGPFKLQLFLNALPKVLELS